MAQEMSGLTDRRGDGSSMELSPSVVYIEACENFQKQSYRNRCRFYGADGVQTLSFPIKHEGGTHKIPISEIKIDYKTPWVQQHERAIVSAYRTSAYFEYYQDELFAILEHGYDKLFDMNMALLKFFIEKTGIAVELRLTEDYVADPEGVSEIQFILNVRILSLRTWNWKSRISRSSPANTAFNPIFLSWICFSTKVRTVFFI